MTSNAVSRSDRSVRAERADRTWAGSTLEARRAQRRTALIEATLDLIAEGGTAAVSVRSVCRQARLTDRYFYESFAGRDELLVTLLEDVLSDMFASVTAAMDAGKPSRRARARAAAEAISLAIAADPRKARLVFVETMSEPALVRAGVGGMPMLSRVLREWFPTTGTREQQNMRSVAVGGSVAALLVAWQTGQLKIPVEELIEYCVALIVKS